jgi:hypothetical protein
MLPPQAPGSAVAARFAHRRVAIRKREGGKHLCYITAQPTAAILLGAAGTLANPVQLPLLWRTV